MSMTAAEIASRKEKAWNIGMRIAECEGMAIGLSMHVQGRRIDKEHFYQCLKHMEETLKGTRNDFNALVAALNESEAP